MDHPVQSGFFRRSLYYSPAPPNATGVSLVFQVLATDADQTATNSEVRYSRLTGDDPIISALRLDPVSGEISVVNGGLIDRERMDRHVVGVRAVNRGGSDSAADTAAAAEATISIRVVDANDQEPRFLKKKYQARKEVQSMSRKCISKCFNSINTCLRCVRFHHWVAVMHIFNRKKLIRATFQQFQKIRKKHQDCLQINNELSSGSGNELQHYSEPCKLKLIDIIPTSQCPCLDVLIKNCHFFLIRAS